MRESRFLDVDWTQVTSPTLNSARLSPSTSVSDAETSAPDPASDHIRIATHSSRASATKIAVISAPMILAIAVPSLVLSHSSGYATRMPEADRPQVHGSSSWTRLPETREAGDVLGKRESCPFVRAYRASPFRLP